MASPPTQPQAARESEQYLRTYKSMELLFILGSTRITRHQERGRNAWWGSLGLEVPAAPKLMTWGDSSLFFVGFFWFFKPPSVFPSLIWPRCERWVLNWRICLVIGIHGVFWGQSWPLQVELLGQRGGMGVGWDPALCEQELPQPLAPRTYPSDAAPMPWPSRSTQTTDRQRDLQAELGILLALMDLTQPHSCGLLF